MRTTVTSPAHDPSQFLRVSRDSLRRASAPDPGRAGSLPQKVVADLGVLGQTLDCVDALLSAISADLWRRARAGGLEVVDGPFAGEVTEALATMDLWMRRAAAAAEQTRDAVGNAHAAVSGLAVPR